MSVANITSEWVNGCLEYRDPNGYLVDVQAPIVAKLNAGLEMDDAGVGRTWTTSVVNSGTLTATAGNARLTTGAADDDDMDVASNIVFNAAKGLSIEGRFRNGDVSATAFNFGFSDAVTEAADKLAYTYATATLTSNATDAALFFYDPDGTTDVFYAATCNNGTDSTVLASITAPTDTSWHKFRIDIEPVTYYATFHLDDALISGTGIADAAMLSTVYLCAYWGFINREGAANVCDCQYMIAWQWMH